MGWLRSFSFQSRMTGSGPSDKFLKVQRTKATIYCARGLSGHSPAFALSASVTHCPSLRIGVIYSTQLGIGDEACTDRPAMISDVYSNGLRPGPRFQNPYEPRRTAQSLRN